MYHLYHAIALPPQGICLVFVIHLRVLHNNTPRLAQLMYIPMVGPWEECKCLTHGTRPKFYINLKINGASSNCS